MRTVLTNTTNSKVVHRVTIILLCVKISYEQGSQGFASSLIPHRDVEWACTIYILTACFP